MLNKKNRIGNRTVIDKLFRKGKLYKNHLFVIKYERASGGPSQFAVSISKKIYKSAVKRNHLRRQIHEALRSGLSLLDKDFIALIITRSDCQKATFTELSQNINTFLKKITSDEE